MLKCLTFLFSHKFSVELPLSGTIQSPANLCDTHSTGWLATGESIGCIAMAGAST
jgi:hypothetical protein